MNEDHSTQTTQLLSHKLELAQGLAPRLLYLAQHELFDHAAHCIRELPPFT